MSSNQDLRRRDFLELAALAGTSAVLTNHASQAALEPGGGKVKSKESVYHIPDNEWRLWLDTEASWIHDRIYLPDEVVLENLPVNAPTGGWAALSDDRGMEVTLPGTVEQHHWGVTGLRRYRNDEYFFAWDDNQVRCGAYFGVSWWWKRIRIPATFAGKKILLRVRGARQRAEVYLNEQLIGYDIIDQTAFTCDATRAARPGSDNILAIRITNPGGRFDWVDGDTTTWNNGQFQRSHGFGGIDRGLLLEAHDPVYLSDVWVLNTREPRTVDAHTALTNDFPHVVNGHLYFSVLDSGGRSIKNQHIRVVVPPGAGHSFHARLECADAKLWDLETPNLYSLRVDFRSDDGRIADWRDVRFGFRWFEADGIGANAMLRLNGRRVRLFSAISWGFWGLNGLWPTPELAAKEVHAAKALNMNCLNFHRQIGREEVLRQQDELGLLRYMEVGGGREFAQGPPDGFCAKYMAEKLMRMFRQFRSHPALVMYCVQNEWSPDLKDPRILAMLRQLHAEDPSRIVTLKDGIVPPGEAWYRAGTWKLHYDHGNGFSGWWCQHTAGGGAGSWEDRYYRGPNAFMYRSEIRKQIVEWGEVGGSAVADNHELMVQQIKTAGGASYDLLDHQQILAAYNTFLERWGFRDAFPTASALFDALGVRCYQWWSILLENFRIAEHVDFCAMSGWESTAIENHSGIVDNLRNHKGPPALVAQSLQPVLPLAKLRQTVVSRGDAAVFDVFLVNETDLPVAGEVQVTLGHSLHGEIDLFHARVPEQTKDQFVYPIAANQSTGALLHPGSYTINAKLTGHPSRYQRNILVVDDSGPIKKGIRVGILGRSPGVAAELADLPGVHCEAYTGTEEYNMLLLGGGPAGTMIRGTQKVSGTPIPWLFENHCTGGTGQIRFVFNALPRHAVEVTLYFAEIQHSAVKQRQFDVQINGRTVLRKFDIFAAAGGGNRAVQRRFEIVPDKGTIVIEPGEVQHGKAAFAGIKIQTPGRTITAYFGPEPIKQHLGPKELIWKPYQSAADLTPQIAERIAGGIPLLVVTDNQFFSDCAAGNLARLGAFEYHGHVGSLRSMDNWMGNWIFVRQHPLYQGLPVNCAMKDDYQVPFFNADGLLLTGSEVEIAAGYSRDHDRNIGAATFTARLGKGRIVFHMMPRMQKIVQRRWLTNALDFLTAS
jgi:hypothetical protein